MSDTPDTDELVNELTERTYTAVAYIIRQLATSYLEKINDTLLVNDTMLSTMSQLIGEMIACYPEEERDAVVDAVIETMTYSQDMMALQLSESDESEDNGEVKEIKPKGKYDLAIMKPQGNC